MRNSIFMLTTSMSASKRELRERIARIASLPRALRSVTALVIVLSLALSVLACSSGVTPISQKTGEDYISAVMETLTDKKMQGRLTGSEGSLLAAELIAAELLNAGIEPFFEGYYQEYKQNVADIASTGAQLKLITHGLGSAQEKTLVAGRDYVYSLPRTDIEFRAGVGGLGEANVKGFALDAGEEMADASAYLSGGEDRVAIITGDEFNSITMYALKREGGVMLQFTREAYALATADGNMIEFNAKKSVSEGFARNVAGVIKGTDSKSACIVGAHYDGCGVCGEALYPSAYDNASGVAAVLGAAREYAKSGGKAGADVIFVLFDGEETGLGGSKAFVEAIAGRYESVKYINVDCVGLKDAKTAIFAQAPNDMALAKSVAPHAQNVSVINESYAGDSAMFSGAQNTFACTVSNVDYFNAAVHSNMDAVDALDMRSIAAVADMISAYLSAEADAEIIVEATETNAGGALETGGGAPSGSYIDLGSENYEKKRAEYVEKYALSGGKAYCERINGSMLALYFGTPTIRTAEELEVFVPGLKLPNAIGEYSLCAMNVNSMLYYGGIMAVSDTSAGQYIYDGTDTVTYEPDTFKDGEIYDFPMPNPGAKLSFMSLTYKNANGDGFRVNVVGSAFDSGFEIDSDAGERFELSLSGISLVKEYEGQQYMIAEYSDGKKKAQLITVKGIGTEEEEAGVAALPDEDMRLILKTLDFKNLTSYIEAP